MYAVITGDIVGSTRLKEQRKSYLRKLNKQFDLIKADKKEFGIVKPIEIFRGDSFQGASSKPEKALRTALLLRSFSRMTLPKELRDQKGMLAYSHYVTDLRISIGIGEIESMSKKVVESDGEAFQKSGRRLDEMKKSGVNLAISTPWPELNREFEASWGLIDAIVSKWTPFQAEAVFHTLMKKGNASIAKAISASGPAVSQRLKTSNWTAIEKMIEYYEEIMLARIK